ncbi:hypothetical protein [Bradyrhizobium sp. sBnM-33]|uniref:hypothetical protein n=1 Tax=Bradyrhizobium sp. sBnM-33 TaxID=2831780 RepID=UPI001BD108DB|nr:hypothetical protein [Bradyrhizobium sp. sBnM-33]WOH50276.1 hypothetical protein RX328_40685 [Bradyrhizobium sp. sBnM-33]
MDKLIQVAAPEKTAMKLFEKLFRPRPPIRDREALADFIDAQSAFIVQKGIYEYSRARAGHYSKVLFAEEGFARSVERARWQAFPLGLSMVGETVDVVLRPHAGDERRAVLDQIIAVVLSVFDRYPVPPSIGEAAWQEARRELAHRLDLAGGHAPKRVMDIPEPLAESYFAMMPIHEKLRGRDFQTTRNYLRVSLCNIHDELADRIDAAAVIGALLK